MAAENRTNLIINYLPQTYSDDEMYTLFSTIGEVVNCKIIRDKTTGYSYGFGFVEYATPAEANNAISSLNGCEIGNKRIKVALARPPGENTKGANLYVRNIPPHYDENALQEVFASFGSIIQCRILLDHNTRASKGVGFVLFETKAMADEAIKALNCTVPPGGTQAFAIKFADDNAKKVRAPAGMGGVYGAGYGPGAAAFAAVRPGGPMRGPGGGRMRYNPMSAGGASANSWGYSGGFAGSPGKQARMAGLANPVRGANVSQFGAGDASSKEGVILFVYNIGIDATENELWNLFSPYGTVKKVNVIWDYAQNKCKGYGFVTMSTMDEAKYAIEYLNGFYYRTAPLQVSLKSDKQ